MGRNRRKGTTTVTLGGESTKSVPGGRRGAIVPRKNRQSSKPGEVGRYMQDAWSLAKRTAVGLNEIRKLINVEHKYVDAGDSVAATQAGVVAALNLIAQGDSVSQRDGDAVKLQTLEFQGHVYWNSSSTQTDVVRIMIVKDAQNTGALIAGSDVLQAAGSVHSATCFPNFINSPNIQSRFSILLDQIVAVDSSHRSEIVRFRSTHDVHLYYRGTGATASDLASGALFLVIFTSSTLNTPAVTWDSRVIFTDN